MSPMDEIRWFQPVKTSYVSVPNVSPGQQILAYNSMRVGLIIANGNTNPVWVAPDQNLAAGAGPATQGIPVAQSLQPIYITQKDYGPVVQSAWFALVLAAPAVTLTIVELLLADWPQSATPLNVQDFLQYLKQQKAE